MNNLNLNTNNVNYYNNLYQNGVMQHNQQNKKNSFDIKSLNERQNQFMESQFNDAEVLDNQYQQHKQKIQPIQTKMQDSSTNNFNYLPETQEAIFMKKGQQNDITNKNNLFSRNNLQSSMIKQYLVNDNRLVMNEENKYNIENDNKMRLNERLYEVGPLSQHNMQFYNPSIQNQNRGFFDFNKPENTRLTFNSNKQRATNDKILSYQELTKEFHRPVEQMFQK